MWLLNFLNLKDLRYLILIGLFGVGSYMFYQNKILKQENKRTKHNYQTALKIDSLEVAVFKVRKQHEIKELLDQQDALNYLVKQSKVKTSRIEALYYQQQKYVDSLKNRIDVTSIVKNIRSNIPKKVAWKDSTECLKIGGYLLYRNDSLNVNVTKREFTNNTVLIKHKGRRKRIKWLFGLRLGPREITFKPQSKCGSTKVVIIDKEN